MANNMFININMCVCTCMHVCGWGCLQRPPTPKGGDPQISKIPNGHPLTHPHSHPPTPNGEPPNLKIQ